MFLFLLYLHTNRIIMSSKNRFMGRQWFPDSITFRKELKKMLTFSWDFALGKHPKATMRWLIIPVGVSSERFCTKYLSLGYATWSHTSLRCGKCLFVNVIHPFFFFFPDTGEFLSFRMIFLFVLCSCCWWEVGKFSVSEMIFEVIFSSSLTEGSFLSCNVCF